MNASERLPNALPNVLPNCFRTSAPNGSEPTSERFREHTVYINIYPAGPLTGPRGLSLVPMPLNLRGQGGAVGGLPFSLPAGRGC